MFDPFFYLESLDIPVHKCTQNKKLSLSSVSTSDDGTETISFTFENAHLQDYVAHWCKAKNRYTERKEEIYNHNTDNMKQIEFHELEKNMKNGNYGL